MQLAMALAHGDAAAARDVIIHRACDRQKCKLTLEASGSASLPQDEAASQTSTHKCPDP